MEPKVKDAAGEMRAIDIDACNADEEHGFRDRPGRAGIEGGQLT